MITMPRFLSAGLTVITDFFRFREIRAEYCWGFRLLLEDSQTLGKLLATSVFVSSIYFSRLPIPL